MFGFERIFGLNNTVSLFKKPKTFVVGIDGVPCLLLQKKFDEGEMLKLYIKPWCWK
jgi:hypothetical protein